MWENVERAMTIVMEDEALEPEMKQVTITKISTIGPWTLANIYFAKREDHLITYKSCANRSQINYFLIRGRECKVREQTVYQQRLLIMDIWMKSTMWGKRWVVEQRIK